MSGVDLAEFYTKPSEAWRTGDTEVIKFWTDDGDCWGFGFHRLSGAHYNAPTERLLIDFDMATVVGTPSHIPVQIRLSKPAN